MTDELVDPVDPPEEKIKAKHLKNRPLVIQPHGVETDTGQDGKEYEYVQCSVHVLDDDLYLPDLRIGWWRAIEQLRHQKGKFVACRPAEQDDNSVILVPLKGEWRDRAEKVIETIKSERAQTEPM